jgi:hypothetical protein
VAQAEGLSLADVVRPLTTPRPPRRTACPASAAPIVGPRAPNGRQAGPRPDELPETSSHIPTSHTRQQGPMAATRQLDFVFASEALADRLTVRARNSSRAEWAPAITAASPSISGRDRLRRGPAAPRCQVFPRKR